MSAAEEGVTFAQACELYPDHEILRFRTQVPSAEFPAGFECLIKVPKAKLRAVRDAGGQPPFWRHGALIDVALATQAQP